MTANQITIQGNLGSDPEIKFSGDLGIASFSVAHTPRTKNKTTGNYEDGETMWFRVTFFGSKAESVVDNYTKGDTVLVIGRLAQSTYTDKSGEVKTSLEIIATDIAKIAKNAKPKQNTQFTQKTEAPAW